LINRTSYNGTLRDRRRSEIAANIAQGKEVYNKGSVLRGTVDQAIASHYKDSMKKQSFA